MTSRQVTLPDGRTLEYTEVGEPGGPLLLAHHGTPGSGRFHRGEVDGAQRLGARLVTYSRPGYAGSSPQPDRSVADAAADVAALLDALGADRFATYGVSGGGPHALACAALLPERCAAAATVAGVGPADAPGLEFMAGMGAGNVEEFGIAMEGRERLEPFLRAQAEGLSSVTPEQLREAAGPHLSDVDATALTGELAEHMHATITGGLAPGIEGWTDDDLAFVKPWGFDLGAITVPVAVWQGEQDLMVPAAHGRWLRDHVPGAEPHLPEQEGHLTLLDNRIGEIQAWLAERL